MSGGALMDQVTAGCDLVDHKAQTSDTGGFGTTYAYDAGR